MKFNSSVVVLLMLTVGLAQNVLAATPVISCKTSNQESFSFQLDTVPNEYFSGVYSGFANDLHPLNVAIRKLPVNISVNPILTRTIVGLAYEFNLPSGTAISLSDINYASPSFRNQLGIKGQAKLNDGETIDLNCTQRVSVSVIESKNDSGGCGPLPKVRWIPSCCDGKWVPFECGN